MHKDKNIIIHLTTIPSRLKSIGCVITSLVNQSVKADKIILSLPKESKREKIKYEVDTIIENFLKKRNIIINYCKNDYGPATKLLGFLETYKYDTNDIIIIVDDDKKYDKDLIKNFLDGWDRNKKCVLMRKGVDLFDNLEQKVIRGCDINKDYLIKNLLGTGGVMYDSEILNKDIFNFYEEIYEKLGDAIFYNDDIFFSLYLEMKNIKQYVIQFPHNNFTKNTKTNFDKTSIDDDCISKRVNPLAHINKSNPYGLKCIKMYKDLLVKK